MQKRKRYAWTWKVREECLEEYVRMHLNPWPEILAEHSVAGIRNYSIFQDGNRFFYCFECENVEKAFQYMDASKVCRDWNAITGRMVEAPFDFGSANPIEFLSEVFYLE